MSGQRNYIYLNKKDRRPKDWKAINCRTLDFTVDVLMGSIVVGVLVWVVVWCMK